MSSYENPEDCQIYEDSDEDDDSMDNGYTMTKTSDKKSNKSETEIETENEIISFSPEDNERTVMDSFIVLENKKGPASRKVSDDMSFRVIK